MFWAAVFALDDRLQHHRRAFGVAGAIVFALTCADHAGFINLPVIVDLPVKLAAVLAVLRYALWDGFVTPRLVERRGDKAMSLDEAEGKGV